jgi:hypothetical protein
VDEQWQPVSSPEFSSEREGDSRVGFKRTGKRGSHTNYRRLGAVYQQCHVFKLVNNGNSCTSARDSGCEGLNDWLPGIAIPRSSGQKGLHVPEPPLYFNAKVSKHAQRRRLFKASWLPLFYWPTFNRESTQVSAQPLPIFPNSRSFSPNPIS